jgi:hypothetical protein
MKLKKNRCWKGYAPVKGKRAYSKGSCRKISKNSMRMKPDKDIVDMLEDPRMMPNLITMLVVGIGLGYAIKIAVDSFKAGQPVTPSLPA